MSDKAKETKATTPAKNDYDFMGQPVNKTETAAWYVGGFAVTAAITAGIAWGVCKVIDKVTGCEVDGNRIIVKDGDSVIKATRVPEHVNLND